MAEINEIVRVSVIIENSQQAVKNLKDVEDSVAKAGEGVKRAVGEISDGSEDAIETIDQLTERLRGKLVEASKSATVSLLDLIQAQGQLKNAFSTAETDSQRQAIAELSKEYSLLETKLISASDAQQVFGSSQLNFDGAREVLEKQISDPAFVAKASIDELSLAIRTLDQAFSAASSNDERIKISELSQAYEGLRDQILELSDARSNLNFGDEFAQFGADLRSQLVDPISSAVLSIREIDDAISTLRSGLSQATTGEQREEIAGLIRGYEDLKQQIIESSELQDVFGQSVATSFDGLEERLRSQISDPASRASLSINDVGEALDLLRQKFNQSTSPTERAGIQELSAQYTDLKNNILGVVEVSEGFTANIVEGVDLVGDRLETQLNTPARRATITLLEVRDAQRELDAAFERSRGADQGQRIAQIRREYDALEEEIVEAAGAQDLFRTRLQGFGASGSAGAASLIQLTRGIEDLRFGTFAAINNIEPFISSLNRLEKVSKATGVSIRQQLIGALGSPAGLLFLFQSALTITAILGPALTKLFSDGADEAEIFADSVESAVSQLIEFERASNIEFKIDADVDTLTDQIAIFERAIEGVKDELTGLGQVELLGIGASIDRVNAQFGQFGRGAVGPGFSLLFNNLDEAEKQQRENAQEREQVLEGILGQLKEQLQLTRILEQAERELTDAGNEATDADAERNAKRIARLRERLDRELAASRKEVIEDDVQSEIAGVEEVYRRRIELARQLGDEEAVSELEENRRLAIIDIEQEARLEAYDKIIKEEEKLAKEQEKNIKFLDSLRIDAIEDELQQAIAAEQLKFEAGLARIRETGTRDQELEAERLFLERIDQIQREFAEKRAQREEREAKQRQRDLDREAREIERRYEQLFSEISRFTDAFTQSVLSAARAGTGISEDEISLQNETFRRQEEALQESLERRLIDREDYEFELRQLSLERTQFQQEVEEENASFLKRLGGDLGDFFIQEAARRTSAFIADAITRQVFAQTQLVATTAATNAAMASIAATAAPAAAAVNIATFGGAAAVGAASASAAILEVQALIKTLQGFSALRGFSEGGFTGNMRREQPAGIVHGGEWVFEQPLVRQDPMAFSALHSFLRKGGDLREMLELMGLRGFQVGGFVPNILPSSTVQIPTIRDNRDAKRVSDQFDRINDTLSQLTSAMNALASRPNQVVIDTRGSRVLSKAASVEQSDVVPRQLKA